MANNFLYIPFLNPLRFYQVGRTNTPTYFTKHFDDFTYPERLSQLTWKAQNDYRQIFQTTDNLIFQFESTFDPVTVRVVNYNTGVVWADLAAEIVAPNKYLPGTYAYEIGISLSGAASGCYYAQISAGSGDEEQIWQSPPFYVLDGAFDFPNFCIEYWSSHSYHADVIFKTGIKFRYRIPGHFGFLRPGRAEERYRDQKYNPTILSSRPYRQFNAYFGDSCGLPDDVIDHLNFIFSCDNVTIDGVPYAIADSGDFEFEDVQGYMKRGVKAVLEPGINRYSRAIQVNTDTTKKLFYAINVEVSLWGDTGNTGSSHTVPINNIQRE
jgi:hypothetical protein